jgi:hypothetical protein
MSRRLPRYPLQTYTDALRSLAKSVDIDRDELIKRNIDAWVSGKERDRMLDGLRSAIDNEDSEKRGGEDWSIAREYVRSLLIDIPDAS